MERYTGLVLSGGGGKGSYQIGVIKALDDLDMMKDITAVSGASVGALNAVLAANGDRVLMEKVWRDITPIQFLDLDENPFADGIILCFQEFMERAKRQGICSRSGLAAILNERLDVEAACGRECQVYVNVSRCTGEQMTDLEAEYIHLNGRKKEEILQYLLASTALPYIYEPVAIQGQWYRDGGMKDNVPLRPLSKAGHRHVIVVKLEPDEKVDTALYEQMDIMEIVPSREIGDLIDGCLDFSPDNVVMRMELGYYDTMRTVRYAKMAQAGTPVSPLRKKTDEANDYVRVLSAVRRDKVLSHVDENMAAIEELLKRYE